MLEQCDVTKRSAKVLVLALPVAVCSQKIILNWFLSLTTFSLTTSQPHHTLPQNCTLYHYLIKSQQPQNVSH